MIQILNKNKVLLELNSSINQDRSEECKDSPSGTRSVHPDPEVHTQDDKEYLIYFEIIEFNC